MAGELLSDAQERSILLEWRFRIGSRNIGDICDKYGLGKKAFAALRKKHGHVPATEADLVIAGVYEGAHTVESLIGYLDYRNHAAYSEADVRGFLESLVAIGVVVEDGAQWRFAKGAPAAENRFVFTAPGT